MKGTHLRGLVVAATFLCMSCLVHGKDKTSTVTEAVTQTITQQISTTISNVQAQQLTQTVTELISTTITNAQAPQLTQTVTEQISTTITNAQASQVPQTVTELISTTITNAQVSQLVSPTVPPQQTAPSPAPAANAVTTGSQGEVFLTIAVQQAALLNIANAVGGNEAQGVITLQPGNAVAAPQATGSLDSLPGPSGIAESSTTGAQRVSTPLDPAQGGFPGGNPPNTTVDLPLTIIFLLLFIGGAVTHISIYRANAKRGHKFLLSDLMFDFCMVRTVTCIFRIIWVFAQPRGVVLAAQIFFNGGASVIFAVNIFLVQRIVRSMHPRVGWSKPFSIATRVMAMSVPVLIISQIISIIILFFSVDNATRLDGVEKFLRFGASYLLILATFPFWSIFLACSIPGPKPEKFGVGNLRVKTSLVMLAAAMLTTGSIVRTYAFFNPRPPDTDDVLYGKPVFYTTQFMLEILVVAAYAFFRFDLLFHIPNGSSKPGDYSMNTAGDIERSQLSTRENIENHIAACGAPHQILAPSYAEGLMENRADEPVYAVFFPQVKASYPADLQEKENEAGLPPRPPRRVSRRESLIEYIQQRPSSTRPSNYGFFGGDVPPIPTSSTVGPTKIAPQYWFDRPRKAPGPPE